MTVTMAAPPGCFGIEMAADGTRYDTDRHGRLEVADHHAVQVRRSWAGHSGTIDARQPVVLGTRATRWCAACRPARAWQAWTITCPRCGTRTITADEPFLTQEEES